MLPRIDSVLPAEDPDSEVPEVASANEMADASPTSSGETPTEAPNTPRSASPVDEDDSEESRLDVLKALIDLTDNMALSPAPSRDERSTVPPRSPSHCGSSHPRAKL